MTTTQSISIGDWVMTWQGGRLADVAHVTDLTRAVDCFEVAGWDWETGDTSGTIGDFHEGARLWIEESGREIYENEVQAK